MESKSNSLHPGSCFFSFLTMCLFSSSPWRFRRMLLAMLDVTTVPSMLKVTWLITGAEARGSMSIGGSRRNRPASSSQSTLILENGALVVLVDDILLDFVALGMKESKSPEYRRHCVHQV